MKTSDNQGKKPGKGGNYPPEGFKKGQSGNPNGRPKGVRNRSTVLKEFLEVVSNYTNPLTNKTEKLTVEEQMALSMIASVRDKHNVTAWKEILDAVYGKQKEVLEVDGNVTVTPLDILKRLESPRQNS
jgi:hypothetical protein